MGLNNKWATAVVFLLLAIIFGLAGLLFLRTNHQESGSMQGVKYVSEATNANRQNPEKLKLNAKPFLPIEAKFVSAGGKNYLKITPRAGADLESELEVKISKWRGSDSKHESTTTRLIKKDSSGIYFQTPPNPNVVPDYYAYRIRFPDLFYSMASYSAGGRGYFSRVYTTYLPGDTVQIENSLCEPIVLQCPLKLSEPSDIKPEIEGKIDFVRK